MKYWVDFNDIDEQGRIVVLRREDRTPVVGSSVYLADHEGNRCSGTIKTSEGDLMYVEPDWSTWTTRRDRNVVPQGWWVAAGTFPGASQGSLGDVRIAGALPENTGDAPVRTALPRVRQEA